MSPALAIILCIAEKTRLPWRLPAPNSPETAYLAPPETVYHVRAVRVVSAIRHVLALTAGTAAFSGRS